MPGGEVVMRRVTSAVSAVALVLALSAGWYGCATRAQTGAAVGAGAGAVVGGVTSPSLPAS